MPTEISIRGRTLHWFTYTVQQVEFNLDGFNDEGYPYYVGYMKKMTPSGNRFVISDETDIGNLTLVYLTHD